MSITATYWLEHSDELSINGDDGGIDRLCLDKILYTRMDKYQKTSNVLTVTLNVLSLYHNIKPASELATGTDYNIFRYVCLSVAGVNGGAL